LNGEFSENPCSTIKILVYFVGGLRGEYEPEICKFNRTQIYADNCRNKKDAMRIALSDSLYY